MCGKIWCHYSEDTVHHRMECITEWMPWFLLVGVCITGSRNRDSPDLGICNDSSDLLLSGSPCVWKAPKPPRTVPPQESLRTGASGSQLRIHLWQEWYKWALASDLCDPVMRCFSRDFLCFYSSLESIRIHNPSVYLFYKDVYIQYSAPFDFHLRLHHRGHSIEAHTGLCWHSWEQQWKAS